MKHDGGAVAQVMAANAVDRRGLMRSGAGALALATLAPLAAAPPAMAAAPAKRLLDPANPEDARKIVRKMRYRLDEGLLFWWIKGDYLGDIDGTLTPLFGLNFASLQEVVQRSDGTFAIRQMELGFRTDLQTGKRLTAFRNPLTNETVTVPFNPIGPTLVQYSADAVPQVERQMGGSEIDFNPEPEHPLQVGNTVFLSFRARSRVTTPGLPDRVINDISMIHGPAAQAFDPAVMSAEAWVHASDVTTFPRWMNMAGRHGSITLRGIGAKVMKIADLPQDFLALLDAHDPAIARDPAAALRRPPATYKG